MMKKALLWIVFLLWFCAGMAQVKPAATDSLLLFGLVEAPLTIGLNRLQQETQVHIDSVVIKNYKGVFKKTLKNINAVPLTTLLKKITISAASPKELSEFYFVAKAADGYAAVISWNELFNSEMGDSFVVVTSIDGIQAGQLPDRIILLSLKDILTGRRYIKGLSSIEVRRM